MSDNTHTLQVPDISCDHCVHAITDAVGSVSGVEDVAVDVDTKQVTVTGGALDAVTAAIVGAGYPVA